jgi:hypothetical protein
MGRKSQNDTILQGLFRENQKCHGHIRIPIHLDRPSRDGDASRRRRVSTIILEKGFRKARGITKILTSSKENPKDIPTKWTRKLIRPFGKEKRHFEKKHKKENQSKKKKESVLTAAKKIISPGNVGYPKLILRSPRSREKKKEEKYKKNPSKDKERFR